MLDYCIIRVMSDSIFIKCDSCGFQNNAGVALCFNCRRDLTALNELVKSTGVCSECGGVLADKRGGRIYCSAKCKNRAVYRRVKSDNSKLAAARFRGRKHYSKRRENSEWMESRREVNREAGRRFRAKRNRGVSK